MTQRPPLRSDSNQFRSINVFSDLLGGPITLRLRTSASRREPTRLAALRSEEPLYAGQLQSDFEHFEWRSFYSSRFIIFLLTSLAGFFII